MRDRDRPFVLPLATALLALILVATLRHGSETPIAHACTGGPLHLEWYVDQATYVAVVDVVDVGGAENSAPFVTPSPLPAGFPPITPTPVDFDLTGISATLRVEEDLLGGAPSTFVVDELARENTEQHIRSSQANPWQISPCPVGFLVPRYEFGQRYVVVVGPSEGDSRPRTLLKFDVNGDHVVLGESEDAYGWSLSVTRQTYQAFFPEYPSKSWGEDPDVVDIGQIEADTIPLEQFTAALRAVFTGDVQIVPAAPTAPPSLPSLEEMACNGRLQQGVGGEVINAGNLSVALPGYTGFAYAPLVMDPGGQALRICHLETRAIITLSDTTGVEVARAPQDGLGDDLLDQLAAGVTVQGSSSRISPPDTGSGALR